MQLGAGEIVSGISPAHHRTRSFPMREWLQRAEPESNLAALFEPLYDFVDDLVGCLVDADRDGIFVRRWFLQRGELAVEEARRHEVAAAVGDAGGDQLLAALGVEQRHARP